MKLKVSFLEKAANTDREKEREREREIERLKGGWVGKAVCVIFKDFLGIE